MVLRWKVVIFLTFLIGLSAVLLSACDRVGENYVLEDGETLDGGQHVVAVEARLESGSVIRGDLNITASDVEINSHIEGDLTVVASNLELGEDARIEGNLIYCLVRNGKFSRNENAVIWGDQRDSCSE
ncbi:MAG TPA: polymer-forming cytoskeletal protein, partial [Aggregatilineales bacterium]|nr:polymer-forming cytoskeletal protein [Aggregatilineales bacterium]